MDIPDSTDVLIVGAGPTGLALATLLAQSGVRHVLVEKAIEPQSTSRALVVHAHTLEVLERIGVSEEMTHAGLAIEEFKIFDRDRLLLNLHFAHLPSKYAHLLMIPQHVSEGILAQRLEEVGGRVLRGVTAETVVSDREHVSVELSTPDGPQTIRARYVVGADGMHSTVRQAAGIAFEGGQHEGSFVLADVRLEWPHGSHDERLYLAPDGAVVVVPMPDGQHKIVAQVDDAPTKPDLADIQSLMDRRGPTVGPARIISVSWSTRYRLHHRLAESFRKGRIFVIGDAAHVHSPAGGQGMNTGLVDAITLGRLLAAVIKDGAPDSTLDLFDELRRPAAAQVLKIASRLTTMASAKRPAIRNLRFRIVSGIPPIKRKMILGLSGLARTPASQLPFDEPDPRTR